MKYVFPKSILVFCIIYFLSNANYAANYTWTGTTSVNWSTSANWNPNGVPSSSDTVTITNQTNNPKLNANTTVKKITMTTGTLDLNTYKLTISNYGYFNGGSINNGMVYQSAISNSSINFSGTTFGAKVSISGTVVSMISTTFSDSVTITQSGSPLSAKGGNTFNGPVYFSSSLSSSIVLSDSLPDTFNSTLEINNTGTGAFYIAHRGTGNQFNGNVKFTGQNIYSNYYGTATYSQNINIYSFSSKGKKWSSVYFGYSTGSCLLATGKTISIDTTATRGAYYFQNFTQQGSGSINFYASDSVHFYFNPGTTFNAAITCSAPFIHLDGAKFNSTANFTNNANMNVTSLGGCFFGSAVAITNNTAGSYTYTIGGTLPDTFQTSATIQNNTGIISINNGVFNGTAYLNNYDSSTTSNRFFVNNTGQTVFHGPLVIDNIKSGMSFGGLYPLVVDCIDCFDMNDVSSGVVTYKNMTVSSDVVIVSQLANGKLVLDSGNTFNGKFTFIGHDIEVKGSVFNDTVKITKTGSTDNSWYGANVFNAHTTITDSSTNGHWLNMANLASDTFNADVVFQQKGAGVMYPAYNFPYYVSGNLSVGGTSTITFGTNAGIVFTGSNNQTISKLASYVPTLKKLIINKPSGSLTLNTPINIVDTIKFQKGIINADMNNIITLLNGGKSTGATDSSFVNGPFKKVGNQAFNFPVGKNISYGYRPIEMTAPTSTTDAYTAEYINSGQTLGSALDTSIEHLNTCEYWKLTRNTGSSKVGIKINWNHSSCELINPEYIRIAGWNGSIWKDFRSYAYAGDSIVGSVTTLDSTSTINIFTTAYKRCIYFHNSMLKKDPTCNGNLNGMAYANVSGGTPPYSYNWSNNLGIEATTPVILSEGQYIISISDTLGCELTDTVEIVNPDPMQISFSKSHSTCGDSTGYATINVTGGVGINKNYFWVFDETTIQSHDNLTAGTYAVLVIDSNGCGTFATLQISNSDGPTVNLDTMISATCFGGHDGSAEISISGNDPFKIVWSTSLLDTLPQIQNKKAGSYIVSVIDVDGCITYDTIEILGPDTFEISIIKQNTICGENEGSAVAVVTGGTSPYFYQWSCSESTDSLISNLNSGIDTVFVTDNNGCNNAKIFEILDSAGITVTPYLISHGICFPDSGGSARVTISNGTAPFTYSWFPSGCTNDTATNLVPDVYTITVIDANGCRQKAEITIAAPPELKLYFNISRPSTESSTDGIIKSIVYGGTPPYNHLWSTDATTPDLLNATIDEVTLIVTDDNGCVTVADADPGISINCGTYGYICTPTPSSCANPPVGCTFPCASINIKTNFGAVGDGVTNDQCAFESAAYYLSTLPASTPKYLFIPSGTYIVGRQEPIPGMYLAGNNVLCFDNIENLTISGVYYLGNPISILKFEDCMKHGAFDINGNPDDRFLPCSNCFNPLDETHLALPGQMIHINRGKNIKIQNLILDGNLQNMKIGGAWPNGKFYDGIFLNACFDVTINKVIAQNFGHDGFWINFAYCHPNPLDDWKWLQFNLQMNCKILNCKSLYNGRNGLSWGGGNGLYVYNSEFNYSGQGRISLQPRAGIDIEFEISTIANSNGIFDGISCKYNKNIGLVSLGQDNHTDYFSRNYTFKNSTFVSSENWQNVQPQTRDMEFNICTFVGQTNKAFHSRWNQYVWQSGSFTIVPDPNNTKYFSCTFLEEYADPFIHPIKTKYFSPSGDDETCPACLPTCPPVAADHQPIIDYSTALGVLFDNCTIDTYYSLKWMNLTTQFPGTIFPTYNCNKIRGTDFINRGLNSCACDRWISFFYNTDFQPPFSTAIGFNGYHNDNACVVASGGQLTAVCIDGGNCINEMNLHRQPGTWYPLAFYTATGIFNPKYKDAIPAHLETDFFSTCTPCTPCTSACYSTELITYPVDCSASLRLKALNESNNEEEFGITVSPNPSNEYLDIENLGKNQEIKIINPMGKIELNYRLNSGLQRFDISILSPGIYMIQTEFGSSLKFVKL